MHSKRTVPATCNACGADFMAFPSSAARYCSMACAGLSPTLSLLERACARCQAPFWNKSKTQRYCSRRCGVLNQPKPSLTERLWSRVIRLDGLNACWEWQGCRQKGKTGHGQIGVDNHIVGTHCVAFMERFGPIPDGFEICHTCDNPPCVRNDEPGIYVINGIARPRFGHLWLGTHAENMADAAQKGLMKFGHRDHPERVARGERKSQSKLTDEIVRDIRRRYSPRSVTVAQLGQEYGVTPSAIQGVTSGRTWKHVQ